MWPVGGRVPIGGEAHFDALQCGVERVGVVDDFTHVAETAQVLAGVEVLAGAQGGLGGGGQHHGHAVMLRQQVEHVEDGLQEFRRQQLSLVEDDHRVDQVVQFAAARSACGKQRFEELHIGGDDDGRVPVFTGQAAGAVFAAGLGFGVAVMLDDRVTEDGAEDVSRLLDDAGVGNDVDDAAFAMHAGVFEREGHPRQRLTAAGGHGQREQARDECGLGATLRQDVGAQCVDRGGLSARGERLHVGVEQR